MCILLFDWLIALYLFTPLPRNTSFIIVKHICVREESVMLCSFFRHNFNKSLRKNIFLVILQLLLSLLCRCRQYHLGSVRVWGHLKRFTLLLFCCRCYDCNVVSVSLTLHSPLLPLRQCRPPLLPVSSIGFCTAVVAFPAAFFS